MDENVNYQDENISQDEQTPFLMASNLIESGSAATHHWQIQKMNKKTGKWKICKEIQCTKNQSQENLKDTIEQSDWGGVGKYRIMLLDADENKIDNIPPFQILIEDEDEDCKKEERTEERTIDRKKKTKEEMKEEMQQMIADDIEMLRLKKIKKNMQDSMQDEDEKKNTDDDSYNAIENMMNEKISMLESKTQASKKEGENIFVALMTAQMQQQAQQSEKFQTLLTSMNKKDDSPVLVEMIKSQNQIMSVLMKIATEPKENPISTFLNSSNGSKLIDSFTNRKDTAIEQALPIILQKTTESFSDFTSKVTAIVLEQAIKPPPLNPDDVLQQKLNFLRGLRELIVPSLNDIVSIFMKMKMASPPTAQNPPAQNPTTNPNATVQNPPAQNDVARMRIKINDALVFVIKNTDKNAQDLIKKIDPEVIEILKKNEKKDMATEEIKNIIGDEAFKKLNEIIDLLQGEKI